MKSHSTKEEAFLFSNLPEKLRAAFYLGWYACGNEINQCEDSDALNEVLLSEDFMKKST